MSNNNFVINAPAAVVEEEREKQRKYKDMMDKVMVQISKLKV